MKLPPFKKRLKHLRKTFAVVMAVDQAKKIAEDNPTAWFNEAFYDLAFEEGFRAASAVLIAPMRDGDKLPLLAKKNQTPMELAKDFGDALLGMYYKRVIR
jgi:hypothetical protein